MNEKVVRYKTFSDLWRILSLFEQSAEELSVSEVARSLGILPSKASRMLRAMEAGLLLERDAKTGRYRIGPRFLILGLHYLRTHPLRRTILPHVEQMSAELGLTSSWAIFRQGRVIVVDRLRPIGGQAVPLIGSEIPVHSSSYGKLFLAYLPEDEQDRILATISYDSLTPNTITTPSALKSELAAIRARGYSIDREESSLNVVGISAPIFDESEAMCAALTVAYVLSRDNVDEARVIRYLADKAVFISRQLGSSISPELAPAINPRAGADMGQ